MSFVVFLAKLRVASGFPGSSMVKNPPANIEDVGLIPGSGRLPWRRKWQPTPVFLLGKSHGQRNLVDYSSWGPPKIGLDLITKKQQKFLYWRA